MNLEETKTIKFEELKDNMKVYMVLPWWSPNFLTATVTKWDDGYFIELNKKVQQNEMRIFVRSQKDLNVNWYVCTPKKYKNDSKKTASEAEEHAKHLLKLTGKSTWNEFFFSE